MIFLLKFKCFIKSAYYMEYNLTTYYAYIKLNDLAISFGNPIFEDEINHYYGWSSEYKIHNKITKSVMARKFPVHFMIDIYADTYITNNFLYSFSKREYMIDIQHTIEAILINIYIVKPRDSVNCFDRVLFRKQIELNKTIPYNTRIYNGLKSFTKWCSII